MEKFNSQLAAAKNANAKDNHLLSGPRKLTAEATLEALAALGEHVLAENARLASEIANLQSRVVALETAAAPKATE